MDITEFVSEYNEYYPFERFIFSKPKQINYLFDDVMITELFIPSTEIKPITDDNGRMEYHTGFDIETIYVKLEVGGKSFRMALYDFAPQIIDEIIYTLINDFGGYAWESLYCETEDESELKEALFKQREMIIQKYGKCKIKDNFIIEDTINILKEN